MKFLLQSNFISDKEEVMLNLNTKLRNIPAIDKLLTIAEARGNTNGLSRESLVAALRDAVSEARQELLHGREIDITAEALVAHATQLIVSRERSSLQKVVNATGVVLHTNLGRAPLAARAVRAVNQVMEGYSNLEYDIAEGARGSRYSHISARLARLVGAEDAIVVNNNAAAVLLVLSTFAAGREVIVSRGELVEIGGSFRVPDIMKQSGAILVEVGTTNKTHLADYQNAITENTAAILKVHTSNYQIIGFTEKPDTHELREIAVHYKLPLIEDLGSGTLLPLTLGNWHEPSVGERLAAGVDIVTFSGDKLLGAGQAGLIAGKRDYIARMKRNPLLRAIRIDKLSLAALEGTLIDYELGNAEQTIPVQRYLRMPYEQLAEKASRLKAMLAFLTEYGWQCDMMDIHSQAGGGSFPGVDMPGVGVVIKASVLSAAALEMKFRHNDPPIVVRIKNDSVIIDVRCLEDDDMDIICRAASDIVKGAQR